MPTVCVDWDGTLVSDGAWLPNALFALKQLRRMKVRTIVHSSRANWDGGRAEIAEMLARNGFGGLEIAPKPEALIYIDNRGHHFTDWRSALQATSQALRDKEE